jgi:hypothetical protein
MVPIPDVGLNGSYVRVHNGMKFRMKALTMWSLGVLLAITTFVCIVCMVRPTKDNHATHSEAVEMWTPIARCDVSMTHGILQTLKEAGINACSPYGSRGDSIWVSSPKATAAQEVLRRKAVPGLYLYDSPLPAPRALQ